MTIGGFGRRRAALVATLGALLWTAMPTAAQSEGDWRETMRGAMDRWIETERLLSQEREDWRLGREVLADRVAVLTNETATLRAQTTQLRADYATQDTRRTELIAQQDALKAVSGGLADEVTRMEARVLALLERSPPPLRERVKPLTLRIPKDAGTATMKLGERFQNVVGILNEVNKFARDITVTSEVMSQPDGTSVEASVIYFGIGQGYYSNLAGGVAGFGGAGETGWTWAVSNELAQAVADVIAVQRNEKPALYIPLPIEVR